jgi:hypothetical protein
VKKLLGAILVTSTAVLSGVPAAQAGSATDAALGLGAFAVFNQIVRGETVFNLFRPPVPVVVQQPVVVAPPPPVVVVPPPPPVYYAPPRVVYGPAPVYYAPAPPGYWKYAHAKKVHPHWKRHYRPY